MMERENEDHRLQLQEAHRAEVCTTRDQYQSLTDTVSLASHEEFLRDSS